jgi:transcriptional regulator with XRE-family HTH domain
MSASENGTFYAITASQVRAARGLLDWTQNHLADASGVPRRTLARFELGEGHARRRTMAAIQAAVEAAGVEFTNGDAPGVRLRRAGP